MTMWWTRRRARRRARERMDMAGFEATRAALGRAVVRTGHAVL